MTLFDRIFGKKKEDTDKTPTTPYIDKALFIEEREPSDLLGEELRAKSHRESEPTVLGVLLERDYFGMGKRDGYEDHTLEVMEERIELIAAGFREAYYKSRGEILERMDQVKLELTPKAKEIMPDQYARVEKKLMYLERSLEEVMLQIDLASCGEGYMEQSVRSYRAGYRKGYTLRLDEEVLFRDFKII
jgi:hypothetical protein